ncbi:MAG: hypothetical protein FWG66_00555 [Spirochaetes bacterium]|nr:hypothetical protein [Spirochaetota bacterium]
MKKILFILLVFLANGVLFAQARAATNSITEAANLVGRPVPSGFTQTSRTNFVRQTAEGLTISALAENGIVFLSMVGLAFPTTHEASAQSGIFFREIESRGTFLQPFFEGDLYRVGNVYAFIGPLGRRDDGLIVASVSFAANRWDF